MRQCSQAHYPIGPIPSTILATELAWKVTRSTPVTGGVSGTMRLSNSTGESSVVKTTSTNAIQTEVGSVTPPITSNVETSIGPVKTGAVTCTKKRNSRGRSEEFRLRIWRQVVGMYFLLLLGQFRSIF
jgi:hypothetical protein